MLIPATRYRDCEAALSFMTGVLGLAEHAVFRDPEGRIAHAQVRLGDGMMIFGPGSTDNAFDAFMADPQEIGGRETTTVYAVLDSLADLEACWARVRDAEGVRVLMPLAEQDYGGSNFSIADPEGHIWSVGTYDPRAAPEG